MKKKSLLTRGVCLALCVMLCGCGGSESSSSSASSSSKESTSKEESKKETSMPPAGERNFLEQYEETGEVPSLSEVYADNFKVGIAIEKRDIGSEEKQQLIVDQFNSITVGNEQKADYVISQAKSAALGQEDYPVVDMKNSEHLMMFANETGMKMRYHTLAWHSQTSRWVFAEGFSTDENAPLVSREVMLARMDNYFKQVFEYINTNYPGLYYAIDVCNEAIIPGSGDPDDMRIEESYWYEVVGPDWVEKAFECARKYAAPEQKLYYNDYGCYDKAKTFAIYNMLEKLVEKDLIDGMGLQSHIGMTHPTTMDYQWAIEKFASLGLEIQITELDIFTTDNTEAGQAALASRYKKCFNMYKQIDDMGSADITSVTIWGLSDDRSWLTSAENGVTYPLLFDKDLNYKPSFFGALQDDSIAMY